MKTKLAEMSLLALVPALAWASDYNISSDTIWSDSNPPSPEFSASGDTLTLAGARLDYSLSGDWNPSSVNIMGENSALNINSGRLSIANFQLAHIENSLNASVLVSGANSSLETANLYFASGAGNSATMTLSDGASLRVTSSSATNIVNANGASGTLNIESGASAHFKAQINIGGNSNGQSGEAVVNLRGDSSRLMLDGNINFLGAYAATGTLNISGGTLSRSDGGKVQRFTIGFTSDGAMNMSGGRADIAALDVGSWLIGSQDSKSNLSLSGSAKMDASILSIGGNYANARALVNISSGANLKAGNTTISESGKLILSVDSSALSTDGDSSTPMFETAAMSVSGGDGKIVVDLSKLGKADGLAAGQDVEISLFSFSGDLSFNGVKFSKSEADFEQFFSGLITFEGAADSEFWEDAAFSDLHYDSASGLVSIGLTYVPESSTCAALFGAFSLLLVLARRRG